MNTQDIKRFAKENGIKLKRGRKPGTKNKTIIEATEHTWEVGDEIAQLEIDEKKWNRKVASAYIFLIMSALLFTYLTIRAYNQVQEYKSNQEWQVPMKGE